MKNIQVIDGADNTAYDIYAIPNELFDLIFPEPEQNIEFIEDFNTRTKNSHINKLMEKMWKNPINKYEVDGIHGTLFFELIQKKKYYPNKKESDLNKQGRPWNHL